jgi:hypothetical protein
MKLWMILMVVYGVYNAFFKKSPEVMEDLPDAQKDTMLVTYYPREGSGGKHVPRRELSEGAKRLMERNPKVPKPFDGNFLDKNSEDIPFTDV